MVLFICTGEKRGLWRDLGNPESSLLGIQYSATGYNTYGGYKVVNAYHWAFTNTGVANGDTIGKASYNKGGASGWLTDKVSEYSPENIEILAKGTNPDFGGAELSIYKHSGGGYVFSAGSITFTGSLPVDNTISQVMKNILDKMLH